MSTTVRNTKEYLSADKYRLIALIYALTGTGKTKWLGTIPSEDLGVAACELGVGNGLLTIADKNVDHIIVENLQDLEDFCKGKIFPKKKVLAVDSISAMAKTFIKDAALKLPRKGGDSAKRQLGIPELDDYGTIAEMVRRVVMMAVNCNPDKHIIFTATEKYDRPNENDAPGTEALIGPELAGQMFLGAPALFDVVLRLRTRPKLRIPQDAKSRYIERFFQTEQQSGVIAKCRPNKNDKALLDPEEIFDLSDGRGSFSYLVDKILRGYSASNNETAASK